jgi:hypothetical protein
MKRTAVILLMAAYAALAWAGPDFDSLLAAVKTQSGDSISSISLSATGNVEGADLLLRFQLTNTSSAPLRLLNHDLPWGDPYSVRWVAYDRSGAPLPRAAIIYDLVNAGYLELQPGASVIGNYRLDWLLKMDSVPPDSDLMIVWAYVPPHGGAADPPSAFSGVTWLHTPK